MILFKSHCITSFQLSSHFQGDKQNRAPMLKQELNLESNGLNSSDVEHVGSRW